MTLHLSFPRLGVLAMALAAGLGGCSTDDIQFNGGLFDAVGLSDTARSKPKEAKVAERAPLVVPPTLDHLPEPGSAPTADAGIAEIKDPDEQKMASREELARRQEEYCKVNYEQAKQRGDETTADNAVGPLGPCRGSVLNAVKNWNSSDE